MEHKHHKLNQCRNCEKQTVRVIKPCLEKDGILYYRYGAGFLPPYEFCQEHLEEFNEHYNDSPNKLCLLKTISKSKRPN